MATFYTYKALQEALRKEGLPSNRTHLNTLEKLGRVSKNNVLKFHVEKKGLSTTDIRIFSEEDIREIVGQVRTIQNM